MKRIIVLTLALGATAALPCTGAPFPPCAPIAPGDGLRVPANAPAFVASGPSMTLGLRGSDAGVRDLEALDGSVSFFAPGAIASGDIITLESACGVAAPSRAVVAVLDAAPFPAELGTVVLGEATGFLRSQGTKADCSPESQTPAAKRTVSLILPDEVFPWLSVARVRVNGSAPQFGHLVRTAMPGAPTLIGEVTVDCLQSTQTLSTPLVLELEVAGRPAVKTESTVELDCTVAPQPPGCGCTSGPGAALVLLGLWLTRRLSASARSSRLAATAE